MEKIKIVSILDKKTAKGGTFWAVNYDNITTGQMNCNATIGQWHEPVAKFIGERVGLGGICEVEIAVKGEYTNIEKVNEGFKDETPQPVAAVPQETKGSLLSVKDINIMAQTFTKCVAYGNKMDIAETFNTFNSFVKLLENNG